MSEHIRSLQTGGLKCDNPECDWEDKSITFENYTEWLNAPCPKCGENVLTDKDYENVKTVMAAVNFVNSLSEDQLSEMSDLVPSEIKEKFSEEETVLFRVDTHDKISIESVDTDDNIKKAIDKTE